MGKKEQAPALAISVQGSLWVWSATSRGRPPDGGLALEERQAGNSKSDKNLFKQFLNVAYQFLNVAYFIAYLTIR